MPVKRLPAKAHLDHLRYQAKDLLKAHAARDSAAAQRIREFHPRFNRAPDAEIFDAKLTKPQRRAARNRARVWISDLGETEAAY